MTSSGWTRQHRCEYRQTTVQEPWGATVDRRVKKLEQENRRLRRRLQKAEALLAFQKKVSELLQIPLKPMPSDEDDLMTAVEAAAPALGTAPACAVLGLPRATLYRRRRPRAVPPPAPRLAPPRALDPAERQAVLETLHSVTAFSIRPPRRSMQGCWMGGPISARRARCTGCWTRPARSRNGATRSAAPTTPRLNCWPRGRTPSGAGTSRS